MIMVMRFKFVLFPNTIERVLSPLLQIGSFELDPLVYEDFEKRLENYTAAQTPAGCCKMVVTSHLHIVFSAYDDSNCSKQLVLLTTQSSSFYYLLYRVRRGFQSSSRYFHKHHTYFVFSGNIGVHFKIHV